eukprot:jgi/Chrpa1/14586/Chrysochromulina_OHIO_Genome00007508-RA
MRQHTSERRDRINDGKPAHDASFTPLTNAGNSLAASKLAIKDVLAGQLPAIAEVFASADRNLSGWVAREAVYDWLVAIAERVGIHDVTARTIEAVIDDFDPSGDGKDQIRYDEWTRLVLRDALFRASTRLIHFIRARDREGKGGVNKALLRHAICAFGLPASRELLDCVFDEMDLERTGWLRYEELQAKLKLGSAAKPASAELLDVLDEAEEQQQEEEGMEEGMEASSALDHEHRGGPRASGCHDGAAATALFGLELDEVLGDACRPVEIQLEIEIEQHG